MSPSPRSAALLDCLWRTLRYRLLVPLKRNLANPHSVAAGAAIGLGVGLTPSVGIQFVLVGLLWVAGKHLLGMRFELLTALAWTWISNPITLAPLYLALYGTGSLVYTPDRSFSLEATEDSLPGVPLAIDVLIPILIGSAMWALVLCPVLYVVTLRILYLRKARLAKRKARRSAQHPS